MIRTTMDFLDELAWRGLLYQSTADLELRNHLAQPGRIAYCGFDPTADSLTIGNFIPVKLLMHWQQAGHKPIVLMGGGTGLIGDPSGRDAERSLMTREYVEANVASQQRIMERLLDFDPAHPNAAVIVNNLDWLDRLGYIEVLRDVGKYFSINEMIQRDSVKRRLEQREQGMSYTEFSYMLLQAYDFLHLRREMNCTVQLAGSDQYGNIVAGIDLIRREFGIESGESYGVTAPLVTRSDGVKMSKSTGQAIWLSADTEERTSPYAFYQYWINLPDADVEQWLKWYTMLDREAIESIIARHQEAPHERIAQRALAEEMTKLIHGEAQLSRVEAASQALFSGDVRSLDEELLDEVFADVPSSEHDKSTLEGDGLSLVELLPETTLASSKREAREFLGNGAVAINGERVGDDCAVTIGDLLHGRTILIRRGKKKWHATRWR
jgi:tyrosyl-tRNA synthetase